MSFCHVIGTSVSGL